MTSDKTLPVATQDSLARAGEADGARDLVGQLLSGVFRITKLLGEGGQGQVYEAEDLVLNRRVAIKVARHGNRSLRREAQALAALTSPLIPAVHVLGVHEGLEYLVMERIYGATLENHLSQRRAAGRLFSIQEVLDVLVSIADGLVSIHHAGVAHRDVKPANVMLCPGGRVLLMDLGIVLPEVDVSTSGVSGTPAYMAPEAIRGQIAPGEAWQIDLYALGVIAFEMLTGELPFKAAGTEALLDEHLSTPAPSVLDHRSASPAALSSLVASLLAKHPSDRPPTTEDVAWRLRGIRDKWDTVSAPVFSVLVVDDDPDARALLVQAVREGAPDAEICTAVNGKDGIEQFEEQPPSLLLLDLQLGDMNGIEVCLHLKGTRLADRCTIIPVSGTARDHDVRLLNQLGISNFVPKGPAAGPTVAALVAAARRQFQN